MLGLQRILSEEKPHLADGLELRAHQIDALAGMLAALLGDAQRNWEDDSGSAAADNGNGNGNGDDDDAPPPLADDSGEAATAGAPLTLTLDFELEDDEDDELDRRATRTTTRTTTPSSTGRRHRRERRRPRRAGRAAPRPGRGAGYRFKHPTASGKTVAAAGFVDAATITGVLILTHRRLLVDQFKRDLTQHGYGGRIREAILDGKRGPTSRRSRSRPTRGSSATPSC